MTDDVSREEYEDLMNENKRLRAALKRIADYTFDLEIQGIADDALKREDADGG